MDAAIEIALGTRSHPEIEVRPLVYRIREQSTVAAQQTMWLRYPPFVGISIRSVSAQIRIVRWTPEASPE